jgi:hypothetical protein
MCIRQLIVTLANSTIGDRVPNLSAGDRSIEQRVPTGASHLNAFGSSCQLSKDLEHYIDGANSWNHLGRRPEIFARNLGRQKLTSLTNGN